MLTEREVERYLCKRVASLGGDTRKVTWIGRAGAPDRLVLLPGESIWVEVKAPGKKPPMCQVREHEALRKAGTLVYVVDSKESVDDLLEGVIHPCLA